MKLPYPYIEDAKDLREALLMLQANLEALAQAITDLESA
jgi:hypothetical protein